MPQENIEEEFLVDQGDGNPEMAMPDPEIEPRAAETEIVIEDDTPAADQGRSPLPDDIRDNLELEDDANNYSKNVQKRMDQLKKAMHDERREKEAAFRERDAAASLTQQYVQQSQQKDVAYAQQATVAIGYEMDQARKAYQEAFDEGDSEAVAKAQEVMNDVSIRQNQINRYNQQNPRPQQQQPIAQPQQQAYTQQQQQPQPQQQPQLDDATKDWLGSNEWFGPKGDGVMTSTAMGVHEELVEEGFRQGSSEYFKRIDARMRDIFPGKFQDTPRRPPSTVVSASGRSPQGRKVVLTESEARLARNMNLTLEQYAAAKAKMSRGER